MVDKKKKVIEPIYMEEKNLSNKKRFFKRFEQRNY